MSRGGIENLNWCPKKETHKLESLAPLYLLRFISFTSLFQGFSLHLSLLLHHELRSKNSRHGSMGGENEQEGEDA